MLVINKNCLLIQNDDKTSNSKDQQYYLKIRHLTNQHIIYTQMLKITKQITKFSTMEPHKWLMTSLGFKQNCLIFNPTIPEIYEMAIAKNQSEQNQVRTSDVSSNGAFCAYSKPKYTNFESNYKIVQDQETAAKINWNKFNNPIDERSFHLAEQLAVEYLNHQSNCIVVDGYAGWDSSSRLKVRTFCGRSYHALFMRNMLIKPTQKELLQDFSKGVDINIFNASQLKPAKFISGLEADQVTAVNLKENKIAILGNQSAEEMKKALFKVLQYYYPRKNILPLHACATMEKNGKTTLFFGLEDSEKSTFGLFSSGRRLIGLDEIAWGDNGIFNIEGGCYTKILNNNHKVDSEVSDSIRYGTLVQNAIFYPNSRNINFYDVKESPNAKTSFPLNFLKNAHIPSVGASPSNIVLFTCDTMGVLPPIARLTPEQTFYHFLSGYSSKINELDRNDCIKAPKIKFDPCFGQEYLSLSASDYGKMLYQKIRTNDTSVWVINTGWTQGKYGQGVRISSEDVQKILNHVLEGKLENVPTYRSVYFNFQVPLELEGINEDLLYPERGWGIRAEFDEQISKLSLLFAENYVKKLKGKIGSAGKIAQQGAPSLI